MSKQRLFVFDAAPVYREALNIVLRTVVDSRKFTANPGLLTPVVRPTLNSVFVRKTAWHVLRSCSGGDDLTTRNIRQALRRNVLDIDQSDYLRFVDLYSTSSVVKRKAEKLLPFTPSDFNFQLHHLDKTIWAIITGTDL